MIPHAPNLPLGVESEPTVPARPPAEYTFAEAVAAGIISPADYSCTSGTECTPPPGFSKFCAETLDEMIRDSVGLGSRSAIASPAELAGLTPDQLDALEPDKDANCIDDPRTTDILTGVD